MSCHIKYKFDSGCTDHQLIISKMKVYRVGGSVRDKLLGRIPTDIDYAVETDSYLLMLTQLSQQYKIVNEKPEYLTLKAKINSGKNNVYADFTLCRKDGIYTDCRHPDSVTIGTILEDLARRDFTMNAIAITESDESIDPYDGLKDIENKVIRCIGSIERLKEDALRLMRAFRFHIALEFELEPRIVECLHDPTYISALKNVSQGQLLAELAKCFQSNTLRTLKGLNQFPLLMEHLFNQDIKLKPTTNLT